MSDFFLDVLQALKGFKTFLEPFFWYILLSGTIFWIGWETSSSYLLLRRFYAGTRRERFWPVLATIFSVARHDFIWAKAIKGGGLFRPVRMRVEHEIFDPRPDFVWPLRDDDPHYEVEDTGTRNEGSPKDKAVERHRVALFEWQRKIEKIHSPEHQTIQIGSPAEINARFSNIKRYFDVLKSLNFENSKRTGHPQKFLCATSVETGFIAPIHLLTGLLVQFNQTWKPILRSFNRDANDIKGLPAGPVSSDLRQIQMFIYNCWLLWGPSIPICTCSRWKAKHITVQYGFGDENNSVEIVGHSDSLIKEMGELFDHYKKMSKTPMMPMALPASVKGRLQLSGSLKDEGKKASSALPIAARQSWSGLQDERPILFVSETGQGNAATDDATESKMIWGGIEPDGRAFRSKYYSAYLWVTFILLKKVGDDWIPVSLAGNKKQPWKDMIPFFEHGNLADPETYHYAKIQLATKVVHALAHMACEWPKGATPYRFSYSCAIDDPGCGQTLAFPDWAPQPTIRELIEKMIAEIPEKDAASDLQRLRSDEIVLFNHSGEPHDTNDYAACYLPDHISKHYMTMDYED